MNSPGSLGLGGQQAHDLRLRVQAYVRQCHHFCRAAGTRRPDQHVLGLHTRLAHPAQVLQPRIAQRANTATYQRPGHLRIATNALGDGRNRDTALPIELPQCGRIGLDAVQVNIEASARHDCSPFSPRRSTAACTISCNSSAPPCPSARAIKPT